MLMTLPPLSPKTSAAFCVVRMQAEDVEVELLVVVLFSHRFERAEFVDAGVVHEDVDVAVGGFGFGEEAIDVGFLRDVGLHGDGLPAALHDGIDDAIRAFFARGVVDNDARAGGGEMGGDIRADAFGGSGNNGDFTGEFLCGGGHRIAWFLSFLTWELFARRRGARRA